MKTSMAMSYSYAPEYIFALFSSGGKVQKCTILSHLYGECVWKNSYTNFSFKIIVKIDKLSNLLPSSRIERDIV